MFKVLRNGLLRYTNVWTLEKIKRRSRSEKGLETLYCLVGERPGLRICIYIYIYTYVYIYVNIWLIQPVMKLKLKAP